MEYVSTKRYYCPQCGVDALELSTADDLVDALLRFTELRKRRGQRLPTHLKAVPA